MITRHNRTITSALLGAVFASGFAALLYQVVWQRLLGLFTGSDVRSVTMVTGAFLAGLGVGSLAGARLADRLDSRQCLRLYGLCNLGIAVFGLASRFLYYDLLFKELGALARSPVALLVVVFASLLLPTTLMGLSLPLLSKAWVRSLDSAAGRIGLLYALNTLGAGLGALVTGWYLAGTLGFDRALQVGGGLSLLVAASAAWIARRFEPDDGVAGLAAPIDPGFRRVPRSVWVWCGLVFLSGFVAISLELIWFRVLDVSLKSNAYTFAYLLFFYLIGDGFGSLVGARIVASVQNPRRAFLWIQAAVALYSLLAIGGASLLVERFEPLRRYVAHLPPGDETIPAWLIMYLLLTLAILVPPAVMGGLYFPIVQKAVQTDLRVVGQRVGLVKVANIAGNTTGSILTGTLLLHYWGTAGALRLIGLLGVIFAGALIRQNFAAFRPRARAVSALLAGALLVALLTFPDTGLLWARLHGAASDDVFLVAEDSSGVAAIRRSGGEPAVFFANGQSQGRIPFSTVHGLLGTLPALAHPNPQRVMVIGIGSGGTPYAVGANPLTRRILAVEIVGAELDALAAYARDENGRALRSLLNDPRYEFVIGDGRRELLLTGERFDVIEADAIRPTASHSGLLYSREFFEAARARLAEGGIMAQWRATDRVEATFAAVFPHVVSVGGVILLGSDRPIPYDSRILLDRLQQPDVVAYLAGGGFDLDDLRRWIQPPLRVWLPDTLRDTNDVNTDLLPRDEYFLNTGR